MRNQGDPNYLPLSNGLQDQEEKMRMSKCSENVLK